MAQKAAPRPLVVARRAEIAHILPHGLRRGVRLRLHQQTFPRVDDLVRGRGRSRSSRPARRDTAPCCGSAASPPRRGSPPPRPRSHRCAQGYPARAAVQALGIVHVAVQPPQRGKYGQSGAMRCGEGASTSSTLAKAADFNTFKIRTRQTSPRSARTKDDKAVDARDARALARIALDGNGVFLIFRDSHSVFPKRARSPAPFPSILLEAVDERGDLAGKGGDLLV